MGIVNFGIPGTESEYLKNNLNLNKFVEGGTYRGNTAKSMSKNFERVFTIENSETMFDIAKQNLKGFNNIDLLKGDTRQYLQDILENNDNILFWLDAHWSGGKTYGKKDECPLIEELEIIFRHSKNYVVLIDDARLFLAPPPLPHDFKSWPSIRDIVDVMPDDWELLEYEDVIYLLPKKICNDFNCFLQKIITKKVSSSNRNPLKTILNKIGRSINC